MASNYIASGQRRPGRPRLNERRDTVQCAFKCEDKLKAAIAAAVKKLRRAGYDASESELVRVLLSANKDRLTEAYLDGLVKLNGKAS